MRYATSANTSRRSVPKNNRTVMDFPAPPQPAGMSNPSFDISSDAPAVKSTEPVKPEKPKNTSYFPLFETLRLYAGWLLAWYGIIYVIGAYQHTKPLPFRIPYAESLFLSPLVLSFTFASFVFLLCSSLSKSLPSFPLKNVLFFVLGTTIFMLYRMNIA